MLRCSLALAVVVTTLVLVGAASASAIHPDCTTASPSCFAPNLSITEGLIPDASAWPILVMKSDSHDEGFIDRGYLNVPSDAWVSTLNLSAVMVNSGVVWTPDIAKQANVSAAFAETGYFDIEFAFDSDIVHDSTLMCPGCSGFEIAMGGGFDGNGRSTVRGVDGLDGVNVLGLPSQSAVPEPGTLMMLGLGLAGIALARQLRK